MPPPLRERKWPVSQPDSRRIIRPINGLRILAGGRFRDDLPRTEGFRATHRNRPIRDGGHGRNLTRPRKSFPRRGPQTWLSLLALRLSPSRKYWSDSRRRGGIV